MYSLPEFSECGPPITAADLNRLENDFKIELPPIYRSFLISHRGGVPSRRGLRIVNHPDGTDLLDFLLAARHPIRALDLESVNREFETYSAQKFFVVGCTGSGSLLVLDCRNGPVDNVFYADISNNINIDGSRKLFFCADDIETMCRSLIEV